MPLPTLADIKLFVRSETSVEDTLFYSLLASATADVRVALKRPLEPTETTYTIEDPRASARAVGRLSGDPSSALRTLRLPDSPVAATPAVTLTDCRGETVDPATYRINLATGIITAAAGYLFAFFPYTATATVGLQTRADYDVAVEPVLRQAILDTAADFYFRRNPAATIERDAGGSSISYGRQDEGIPLRVLQRLAPFANVVL